MTNLSTAVTGSFGRTQNQPQSTSLLQNSALGELAVQKLPKVRFFTTTCDLPGLAIGNVEQTSMFVPIPRSGDTRFEDFTLNFLVDENLSNWIEAFNWIKEISLIKDFDSYDKSQLFSNGSLITYTNKSNLNVKFTFIDMFPVALSGFSLERTASASEPVQASLTFAYTRYDVEVIDSTTCNG